MASGDIVDDLGNSKLFRALTDDQLRRVAARAVYVEINEGEPLFEQQDRADRFYLLLNGQIKLFRLSPDGDEKIIEVVTPGGTFAEALMFLEKPTYPVGAQALSRSRLISVDSHDFVAMLRDSVDTCLLLAADLSQRLHGLLREINDLSLNTGTCRVAAYFLQHAPAGESSFELPLAKQVLASRLSIKPETLSRIFRGLTNAGLISMRGTRVTILDKRNLEELAQTCVNDDYPLESTFHYPRQEGNKPA